MKMFVVHSAMVLGLLSGLTVYASQPTNTCTDASGNSFVVTHGKINHATLTIVMGLASDGNDANGSYTLAFDEGQERDTGIFPFSVKTPAGLDLTGALSFGSGDWTLFTSTHAAVIIGGMSQAGFIPLFSSNMTCKPGKL